MILAGVPETHKQISAVSGPKFAILWGHVEEILLFSKFFFRLSIHALVAKLQNDEIVRWCPDGKFLASCIFSEPRAAHFRPGVLLTIACARMQKILSYASSAILHTCYSLTVRKTFLTYAHLTMIVFYLKNVTSMGMVVKGRVCLCSC